MATKKGSLTYEEEREMFIEENKKRLHELGLDVLVSLVPKKRSPAVRKHSSSNDSINTGGHFEKRRSTRLANSPRVDYNEGARVLHSKVWSETPQLSRSRVRSQEPELLASRVKCKLLKRGIDAVAEMKTEEDSRATGRERDYPYFIKGMLKSHTSGGFWLGMPSDFCAAYFDKDDRVILEDEDCKQWECKYLHNKHGLSGGWRGFSLDHHLRDGDALLFQLVSTRIFKVKITRARSSVKPASERYALRQEYQRLADGETICKERIQGSRKRMSNAVNVNVGDDVELQSRKILKNMDHDTHAQLIPSRLKSQKEIKTDSATDFPEVRSETDDTYQCSPQDRQSYSLLRLASLPKSISVGDFAVPSRRRKLSTLFPSQKHPLVRPDGKSVRVK